MRLARLLLDPLGRFEQMRAAYGPVARIRFGRGGFYLVCDPAAIQDVLVASQRDFPKGLHRRRMPPGTGTQPLSLLLGQGGLLTSSGDQHRTHRRLMAPLFHRHRVAEYAATFARLADERAAAWADGERIDVHAEMGELTLAIVARTVFDADIDSDVVATIRRAVTTASRVSLLAAFPRAMAVERRRPSSATRRAWQARDDLYTTVGRMLDDRRRAGAGGGDLMSLLLAARDAETGEALDDDAVREEALTILLAGHETTANALTWTYHLIGGCPRVAAAMHAELDAVLGDRLPGADDIPHLPYTRAVFIESLRLYPPVWMIIRRSLRDCTLAGVRIPADSTIVMSPWVVHRDPELWPDPTEFRPERWLEAQPPEAQVSGSQRSQPARFTFFPFGGGTRRCIGNTFAEMEGIVILATVGRRWAFEAIPGTHVQPLPRVVLRPKGGLPMTARRR